jgi:hypothetical protein
VLNEILNIGNQDLNSSQIQDLGRDAQNLDPSLFTKKTKDFGEKEVEIGL